MSAASQAATVESLSLAEQIRACLERTRALLENGTASEIGEATAPASPLNCLVSRFSLSPFERDVLLFCAAVELDPQLAALVEASQPMVGLRHPTFQLLMHVLPDPHWSALMPKGALRRWKLVELVKSDTLTGSPLRIDENVLHFLMGVRASDERLDGILQKVAVPKALPQSYRAHAERIVQVWNQKGASHVAIQLLGNGAKGKTALASAVCAVFGLGLRSLSADDVPRHLREQHDFLCLLERDSTLNEYAVVIEAEEADPAAWEAVSQFVKSFQGFLLLCGAGRLGSNNNRVEAITIDKPSTEEQSLLWRYALGELGQTITDDLDRIPEQFSLDLTAILDSAERVLRDLESSGGELRSLLWDTCRSTSRPALERLAQHIETCATWGDIVLPQGCLDILRTIAFQMRQRSTVLNRWGFAQQSSRGLGTAALFHGHSGTGKTLAAEILAHELSLDLFHIDLSQIVSKYIGESEKNLRAVFDAAEDTGAILLFDEADALFGKRSEIRDSHDRYANIEVSYLLQRMEAYRGLAILTTNQRGLLDSAFLRRIRFVVHFPYPDAQLRRQIWQRIFPPGTPTEGLDLDKLARLNLPGGNLRNIALNAAFIAAEKGQPLRMLHLLQAARQECSKLERALSESEIGGWQ
jgi:ATPase family associated with various cellular activities (AAA)